MTRLRLLASASLLLALAACNSGGGNTATSNAAAAAMPVPADSNAPWQTTQSGLRYRRISGEGTGPKPGPTDTVTLHYVGRLMDGTVFDSSFNSGQPATMPLPGLIPGWREGVPMMSVGDIYEFVVPPELGYGAEGAGPIPANATLHFTVGLIGIEGQG